MARKLKVTGSQRHHETAYGQKSTLGGIFLPTSEMLEHMLTKHITHDTDDILRSCFLRSRSQTTSQSVLVRREGGILIDGSPSETVRFLLYFEFSQYLIDFRTTTPAWLYDGMAYPIVD